MRFKEGFVMRDVAGQAVAVATGEASKSFHGMIKLNSTGSKIWRGIEAGDTETAIADNLANKYGINPEQALSDVATFIARMREIGIVED